MTDASALAAARGGRKRPGAACEGGILAIIAHPDDELFVSGTLLLCAEAGLPIQIVSVTDGEGGGPAQTPEGRRDFAWVRQQELSRSAAVLGANDPTFLHYADVADPECGQGQWNQADLVTELSRIIAAQRPELILTHGPSGGYGHPAHRLTSRCVMAAARNVEYPGAIFSFCAQVKGAFLSWHFDQPSDVRIDVRGFHDRRAQCLVCHHSQRDFFLQPYRPRSLRKLLSAVFGYAMAFTEAGRKRVPIATGARFFEVFPREGLALQKPREGAKPHFFQERFGDDDRVQIDR